MLTVSRDKQNSKTKGGLFIQNVVLNDIPTQYTEMQALPVLLNSKTLFNKTIIYFSSLIVLLVDNSITLYSISIIVHLILYTSIVLVYNTIVLLL